MSVSTQSNTSTSFVAGQFDDASDDDYHNSKSKNKRQRRRRWNQDEKLDFALVGVSIAVVLLLVLLFIRNGKDDDNIDALLQPPSSRGVKGPYSDLPLCINRYEDLPDEWKQPLTISSSSMSSSSSSSSLSSSPSSNIRSLSKHHPHLHNIQDAPQNGLPHRNSPWTLEETQLAETYLNRALDEIVEYYENQMTDEEWVEFQPDGMNSLMDMSYINEDQSEFGRKSLKVARDWYIKAVAPYQEPTEQQEEDNDHDNDNDNDDDGSCSDGFARMKLLDFGHYLTERLPNDVELHRSYKPVLKNVQQFIKSCGTLDRVLDITIHPHMFDNNNKNDDRHVHHRHGHEVKNTMSPSKVFSLVLHAIGLVELQTIPGVELPPGADWFVANLWNFLSDYTYLNARDDPENHYGGDGDAQQYAWLMTHVAYLPTGYGRHRQLYDDAPFLYQYVRENFFFAIENGRIDLVSEFVDLVRTYGCSEDNDYQLRYGTRWVLHQLESSHKNGKWIDYEKNGDDTYSAIHDPWAGSAGVMLHGNVEPVVEGSYGAAFYNMLKKGSSRKFEPTFTSSSSHTQGNEDDDETNEEVRLRDHRHHHRRRRTHRHG